MLFPLEARLMPEIRNSAGDGQARRGLLKKVIKGRSVTLTPAQRDEIKRIRAWEKDHPSDEKVGGRLLPG
ncbi:MAG: hypothetical protein R6V05_14035 [Candidatus Brocadiia bacterium]